MIKCIVCNNEFSIITNSHLKKHNLTPEEYKLLFGEFSLTPDSVREKVSDMYTGSGNPNFGNHPTPWNKGKVGLQTDPKKGLTWEEYYGDERAKDMKHRLSKSKTGIKMNLTEDERERRRNQARESLKKMDRIVAGAKCSITLTGRYKGELNPNWRGGLSEYEDFSEDKKEFVRNHYNRKCIVCGKNEEKNGRKLDVHHVDHDKKNGSFWNLLPLCHLCHIKEISGNIIIRRSFIDDEDNEPRRIEIDTHPNGKYNPRTEVLTRGVGIDL